MCQAARGSIVAIESLAATSTGCDKRTPGQLLKEVEETLAARGRFRAIGFAF